MAMKRFVLPAIILTLCLFLTSCGNIMQKSLSADGMSANTVMYTGRIGISGAFPKEIADTFTRKGTSSNATRTAFPSAPTETTYYVEVKDTSVTPNTSVNSIDSHSLFNVDQDTGVFSLPLELNHAYTITVSLIQNNDPSKPLLSDSVSQVKLTAAAPVYVHDFILTPSMNSGTGSVELPLNFSSLTGNYLYAVKQVVKLATATGTETDVTADNMFFLDPTTGMPNLLKADSINSGAYRVILEIYEDPSGGFLLSGAGHLSRYNIVQTVNVYDNLVTDTWIGGESYISGGAIALSDTDIPAYTQSTFYVDSTVAASGTGSSSKPFKTFYEALYCANLSTAKSCTIHLKDGYTETITAGYADLCKNLTIESWKTAVGDGKGTASINASGASVSSVFKLVQNGDGSNPAVTLKGITLSGSAATGATGIELVNGNLTLENCQITGFQTTGINVASTAGTLTVSGLTYITGNGTGDAISNVKLAEGKKLTVAGKPASGSRIGIRTATEPAPGAPVEFVDGWQASYGSPASVFSSDSGNGVTTDISGTPVLGVNSGNSGYLIDEDVFVVPSDTVFILGQQKNITLSVKKRNEDNTITDIPSSQVSWTVEFLENGEPAYSDWYSISGNTITLKSTLPENMYTIAADFVYNGRHYSDEIPVTPDEIKYRLTAPTSGTYAIASADEIQKIAEWANSGSAMKNVTIKLDDDITMPSGFTGIGSISEDRRTLSFSGTFDGQGHTVNLGTISTSQQTAGLFGCVNNATIKNVHVTGTISGSATYAGGIVGYTDFTNETVIENCINDVNVSGTYAGGIVGHVASRCTIKNCINNGQINGTEYSGGLVGGKNAGADTNTITISITNSINNGAVEGQVYYGGIVGNANSGIDIKFCANTCESLDYALFGGDTARITSLNYFFHTGGHRCADGSYIFEHGSNVEGVPEVEYILDYYQDYFQEIPASERESYRVWKLTADGRGIEFEVED